MGDCYVTDAFAKTSCSRRFVIFVIKEFCNFGEFRDLGDMNSGETGDGRYPDSRSMLR